MNDLDQMTDAYLAALDARVSRPNRLGRRLSQALFTHFPLLANRRYRTAGLFLGGEL